MAVVLLAILSNIWFFGNDKFFLGVICFFIFFDRVFLGKDEMFFRVFFSLIFYYGVISLAEATIFADYERAFAVRVLLGASWAWLQELLLLGFFGFYLRQVFGNETKAAFATALVFSAVHLPNPLLSVFTFIFGFVIAKLVYRFSLRLIYLTAPIHALAATAIVTYLPLSWHHNLRIGPHYFQ